MSRRKRLPFVATRIVWACRALTMTERALWVQHYGYEKTAEGCILGAGAMGRRLAISRETVEVLRRRFVMLGLMRKRDRGLGREAGWYVMLPKSCWPRYERMTDEQVEVWAESRLTVYLGTMDPSPKRPADGENVSGPKARPVRVRQGSPRSGVAVTTPLTLENPEIRDGQTTPLRRSSHYASFPAELAGTSGDDGKVKHRNYELRSPGEGDGVGGGEEDGGGDGDGEGEGGDAAAGTSHDNGVTPVTSRGEASGPGLESGIPLPDEEPDPWEESHSDEPMFESLVEDTP